MTLIDSEPGFYADGGIGMDGEWAIPPGLKLKPP